MATKTFSIDLEPYDRLCAVRKQEESFSQAIKRVIRKPISPDEWFAKVRSSGSFDDEFVRAVEESRGDRPKLLERTNGDFGHDRPDRSIVKRSKARAKADRSQNQRKAARR